MIEIYNGNDSPILLPIENSNTLQSRECLCFYKTVNNDGVHGYIKIFGVLKKLKQMEESWSDTNENPIRTPDYWTYSSNLDELLSRRIGVFAIERPTRKGLFV